MHFTFPYIRLHIFQVVHLQSGELCLACNARNAQGHIVLRLFKRHKSPHTKEQTRGALIVIAVAGCATCPGYAGANSKFAISALDGMNECITVCQRRTQKKVPRGNTHTSTAFISLTAMVLPMQPCGPAMKENCENAALYALGRASQRAGWNLHRAVM
jgi:hypothetical protein